jgi:hypothetical protein
MRSCGVIALAVALLLAGLVSYSLFGVATDYSANYGFIYLPGIGHAALGCASHLLFIIAKSGSSSGFHHNKSPFSRKEADVNSRKLSLFKGREARLNRAILLVLFPSCPLVVYDITKGVRKRRGFRFTKYTNVNRRVRALTAQGYLESVGSRELLSGFRGTLYQPTIRAKFAFYLNLVDVDRFVREACDEALVAGLAAIVLYLETDL